MGADAELQRAPDVRRRRACRQDASAWRRARADGPGDARLKPGVGVAAASAAAARAAAAATRGATERRLRGGTVNGEHRDLFQDIGGVAGRAGDDLLVAADEFVEVILALHARILEIGRAHV